MTVGRFSVGPPDEPHRVRGDAGARRPARSTPGVARARVRPHPPRETLNPPRGPQPAFPPTPPRTPRPPSDGFDAIDASFEPELPRSSHRGRRRRHRDRRHSATAFLVVIGVFAVIALVGWWGYGKIHEFFVAPDYAGPGSGSVSVKINNGDSISAIGNTLVRAKVVKSAGAFVDAADNDQRSRKLQPGTYNMRKKMSAKSALGRLLDPAARVSGRFTVREGLTVKSTLALIHEHTNISLDDLEAAAKDPKALGVPDWGKGNLEGFLFPNTYEVDPSASAADALKQMVSQANAVFTQLNFAATAQQAGYDPYQVLTVASMVEMEGVADDFGKIARVAYNRLSADMPLQFDSTTQYWLELNGQGRKKDKLTDGDLRSEQNNYSTTTNRGLPPTAISNPGKSAIQAALSPPAGNWLYFAVTSENGHSSFTNNLNQHNQNVQICRQKKLGC